MAVMMVVAGGFIYYEAVMRRVRKRGSHLWHKLFILLNKSMAVARVTTVTKNGMRLLLVETDIREYRVNPVFRQKILRQPAMILVNPTFGECGYLISVVRRYPLPLRAETQRQHPNSTPSHVCNRNNAIPITNRCFPARM